MIRSELDLSCIEEMVAECGTRRDAVIPILQAIQHHYRYLPQSRSAARLRVDRHHAGRHHGRLDVLHSLSAPAGRPAHDPRLSGHGLPCEGMRSWCRTPWRCTWDSKPGQDTDAAGEFTVQSVACLGCCTLAPVMQIDDATYGRVTPRSVSRVIAEALRPADDRAPIPQPSADSRPRSLGEIRIGLGSCCQAQGSG